MLCIHDSSYVLFIQVGVFAKVDTHQPGNDTKCNVLAIRYENLPCAGSFTKSKLTTAITLGSLGVANQAKTFNGKREKASVNLSKLPDDFVQQVVEGNFFLSCSFFSTELSM